MAWGASHSRAQLSLQITLARPSSGPAFPRDDCYDARIPPSARIGNAVGPLHHSAKSSCDGALGFFVQKGDVLGVDNFRCANAVNVGNSAIIWAQLT